MIEIQGETDKPTEWYILTILSQKSDNQVHTHTPGKYTEALNYTSKSVLNDTHRILHPT